MSATAGYQLFTPLTIGKDLVLRNRVVFGPLTCGRSNVETRAPTRLNETYYEQRAGAGLIITEATAVSAQAFGWYAAPGLYTDEHAAAWKKVEDRVHAKGGRIVVQLWHMGRQSHSSYSAAKEVVSASAIPTAGGHLRDANNAAAAFEVPRALETDEIPAIVEDFRKSAALAKEAGFDGVEIHGANGYLIDQFLQTVSNKRTDQYGGSWENRARFLIEIVEAVKTVWPGDRIGVRLGPNGWFGSMGHEENHEYFTYVVERLSTHGLGYLAILDGFGFGYHNKCRLFTAFDAKQAFKGTVIAFNSYTRDIAEGAVRSGAADAVGFGRPYISNPDLAERFENDWPLNEPATHSDYYYNGSETGEGYISFPAYSS